LLVMDGELSEAVIARSTRSNVDQDTDPDELALNWIPAHGNGEAVLFAVNVIRFEGWPFATRAPSTKRWTPGSNLTVTPAMIVKVAGARTVTAAVAIYGLLATSQVVSVVMGPLTYFVALTVGEVTRTAVRAEARTARTIATLLIADGERWARMCVAGSWAREFPAPVVSPFPATIYYADDAVILDDNKSRAG